MLVRAKKNSFIFYYYILSAEKRNSYVKKSPSNPKKWKRKHRCEECNACFINPLQVKLHKASKHGGFTEKSGTHPCDECDYVGTDRNKLKRHKATRHENNQYPCTVLECNYVAKYEEYLKHHIQAVHQGIRYNCDQCAREFSKRSNLLRHIRAVHDKS